MKNIVVLSGAGMSADSGISTFRDKDGLWENHSIYEVATPQAWHANQAMVLEFYNQRRKQLFNVKPNAGHLALQQLEADFNVQIITQNIDDLHERAGSSNVLHLHGELKKARSTKNPSYLKELTHWELKQGDLCPEGSQLRPHVVWFGEAVPNMDIAAEIVQEADALLVVGTSLQVYPAAGLVDVAPPHIPVFVIDPAPIEVHKKGVTFIRTSAAVGLPTLIQELKTLLS